MGSAKHLVQQYAATQAGDLSNISFTVQLAATAPKLRVLEGRFKRHRIRAGVIWLRDLCQICELLLHTLRMSQMERFWHHFGCQSQKTLISTANSFFFSFVPSDLQALKLTSFQQQLPEFVWQAGIPFQINTPDLMYSKL